MLTIETKELETSDKLIKEIEIMYKFIRAKTIIINRRQKKQILLM